MENSNYDKEIKILVVDDDKSVRYFLDLFLKKKGYQNVQSVETGQEALDIIKKEEVNLVLLDVRLPDLNGVEVLRRIKQINEQIPVIMITAYPEEEKAKEAIKEGAYDYIVKPFDLYYLELILLTKIIQLTYGKKDNK